MGKYDLTPAETRIIEVEEEIDFIYDNFEDEPKMPDEVREALNLLRTELGVLIEAQTLGFGNVK